MENMLSSNMPKMPNRRRGQRTHIQVPAPNSRNTVGTFANHPQKLDGIIKHRANGGTNDIIMITKLDERAT